MTSDDERRIEQYLRCPNLLSAAERERVETIVDQDRAARAYLDTLDTFYGLLDEEERRDTAPQVEDFVDELFAEETPPAVVQVHPFQSDRSSPSTVMAAATSTSAPSRRFSVLATLAAAEEDVLVRVIGDAEEGQGRLYVLSDRDEQCAHAVVSFPDFGLDLVTDENGRLTFDLPADVEPEEWEQASAVVRRPLVAERLGVGTAKGIGGASGAALQCRWDDGTLSVTTPSGEADTLPSLMTVELVEEGAERRLLRLASGETIQHDLPMDGDVRIRLYD